MGQHPGRVITYIDGFNLYFGLRDRGFRRYYWLDMPALAQNLIQPGQALVQTKYFTSRIAGARPNDSPAKATRLNEKKDRQSDYLDALATRPGVEIHYGHYLPKDKQCRSCKARWTEQEEKMTDVKIATHMLVDAFQNAYDTALLISADSDLAPPIEAIKQVFPKKRVIVAFPPKRNSARLRQVADAQFTIGRGKLKASLLPDPVVTSNGIRLACPTHWV